MPGYLLHLTEGKFILDQSFSQYDDDWKKLFMLGTILPDFCSRTEKFMSHFWQKDALNRFYRIPDLSKFSLSYKKELEEKNPLIFGVYAHLMLDYAFYTDYFPEILEPVNREGKPHDVWDDDLYIRVLKSNLSYRKEEFFSSAVLYGDYSKLNRMLLDRYMPYVPCMADIDLLQTCYREFRELPAIDLPEKLLQVQAYLTETPPERKEELLVYHKEELEERLIREAEHFSAII